MQRKPRIAVVIGSTRASRFADVPAKWILDLAAKRAGWEVETLDLRDFDLPFFDEMASNLWMPSQDPRAVRWQEAVGRFDGYIFIVAEYNRSLTGALKNALDQAYKEWNHKPMAVFGYGSTGGARAIEHLRSIAVELQMVPVRQGLHLLGGDFMKVHPLGGENAPMSAVEEHLLPGATGMLDDLDWWLRATMPVRAEDAAKA